MSHSPSTSVAIHAYQGDDSAGRIFRVARKLFAEQGFAAVSMRDIAEHAQMSKANVFHHFKTKADLYKCVLTTCASEFDELLDQLEHSTSEIVDVLEHLIHSRLKIQLQDRETGILFLRAILEYHDNAEYRIVSEIIRGRFQRFTRLLTHLRKNHAVKEIIDNRTLALLIFGSHHIYWLMHPHLSNDSFCLPGPDDFSKQVANILIDGILVNNNKQS
jgi:TetR/AcrR family transcriptional regulator